MIREKTHPCASVISVFLIKAPRMAIVPFVMPTAYGDGLWGLQNTDITDAHGSIITDYLFFLILFDGPVGLWILDGFFAGYMQRSACEKSVAILCAGGASKPKQ